MKKSIKFSMLMFLLAFVVMSCKNENKKAEVSEAEDVAQAVGADFKVDPSLSKVLWEGYKPSGSHNGTVEVSEGSISVKDGKIAAGNFMIDMNTINVLDLEGEYKNDLEGHLKGTGGGDSADHFFNVTKYPVAKFEITKVTNLESDPEATHMVYGNLTMKDITKQVGFRANVDITEDAVKVSTPKFDINRTDWGIKFKSKSFVDDLKDNFINDNMGMSINLTARG